jgi:GNAT superfamily N-acetyltransferase
MKIITLSTEKDKLGNEITIKKCDSLAHSPVYTSFLRNFAEIIDKGFAYPTTSWNDDECEAVYAELNGKILGHIVYSKLDGGTLFIKLSAVDPQYRKNGIYTILHKHFENVAKEYGCNAISSIVHKNNSIRLESIKKFDLLPEYYFMAKKL